jgi:glycosyltransferase involved in cell wall biosynthesis
MHQTNFKTPKNKIALLTNMLAPHRLPIYSILADQFDLLILHGGREANREAWGDLEKALPKARVCRAWGWQIPGKKRIANNTFDDKFIHVPPGILWHLLRFKPRAIISSEMGLRSLIALAYGGVFHRPVWIWWGGTPHSERNIGVFRRLLRKTVTMRADRWITYGRSATEYLLELGVKRELVLELQNSVDESHFKADVPPAWAIQPRPVILYVGRLVEPKGVRCLLDAAAMLQRDGLHFSILLVGDGPEKLALQQHAKTLGLRNVIFQPAQPPEKMPAVYRSADIMVLPTFEDVWGLVANEAILCGIPVLCSKYAGCAPELFPPEHIFAPEDLSDFSAKLAAAISGRLSKSDPARLKTTEQLGGQLVQELNSFLPGVLGNRHEPQSVTR